MAEVMIYSSPFCGYCFRAKRLLDAKGVDYEDVNVMLNPTRRHEMIERAGGVTSVPQIFIGETHIGGSDELMALEAAGELDPLLQ
jgi:glutaredoxin 3